MSGRSSRSSASPLLWGRRLPFALALSAYRRAAACPSSESSRCPCLRLHKARACRRSLFVRHSGVGLRPRFLSAGARCCGGRGFPIFAILRCGCPDYRVKSGSLPCFPESLFPRRPFLSAGALIIGIGGAAPVNPCPRSARGGAVFFIVVAAGADRPRIGRNQPSPPPSTLLFAAAPARGCLQKNSKIPLFPESPYLNNLNSS